MTKPTGRKPGRPKGSGKKAGAVEHAAAAASELLDVLDTEREEIDELEIDDPEEATSIDALLAEYGEDAAFVNVSRYEGGAWVFLDRLDIGEASPTEIKAKYGGGRFRMKLLDAKMRYRKSITFRIAGKPKTPDEDNGTGAIDPTLTGIDRVLARLDNLEKKGTDGTTNEILKLVVAAALRPPPTPPTPQRDPLMETLITALIAGRGSSAGLDQMQMLKLLGDAEKRGEDRGRTLGEALAAAAGEGDGVARVLASTLPQVIDAFGTAKQSYDRAARPTTATARVTEPAPTTTAAPPPTEEPAPVNIQGLAHLLRPAVPQILAWARGGKDAAIKAANVIDDLNDMTRDAIAAQAESPTFVADVIAAVPEFQAPPGVHSWVIVFLSQVQEILTTPDDEEHGPDSPAAEA